MSSVTLKRMLLAFFCLSGICLLLPISASILANNAQTDGTKADLIMVFPGTPERIAAGFHLAQAGQASKLAISNAGMKALEANAAQYGRPASVKFVASSKSRSTFEDVFNTREIVRQHGIRSLMLVTSSWHLPRSVFLLKCFLAGTGVAISVFPVADPRTAPGARDALLLKAKFAFNETVKCWGSTVEMTWSLLTGTLLLDRPFCRELSEFIKRKVLFTDQKHPAASLSTWLQGSDHRIPHLCQRPVRMQVYSSQAAFAHLGHPVIAYGFGVESHFKDLPHDQIRPQDSSTLPCTTT